LGFQRSQRVGEAIHKEISALLIKGLKDPRIGFVTITGVEVTPDLHLARVYFTAMGEESAQRATQEGLNHSVPFLRRELGKRLRMRYVPDLMFLFDSSVAYGNRIEKLLQDINTDQTDDQQDTEGN